MATVRPTAEETEYINYIAHEAGIEDKGYAINKAVALYRLLKALAFEKKFTDETLTQFLTQRKGISSSRLGTINEYLSELFNVFSIELDDLFLDYQDISYSREKSIEDLRAAVERLGTYYTDLLPITYSTKGQAELTNSESEISAGGLPLRAYGRMRIIEAVEVLVKEQVVEPLFVELMSLSQTKIDIKFSLINQAYFNPQRATPVSAYSPHVEYEVNGPTGYLHYKQNKIPFSVSSIEHFIIAALFDAAPAAVQEDEVIEAWGGEETKSTVKDALLRIRSKVRQAMGVSGMVIRYRNAYIEFAPEMQELLRSE